MSDLVLLEDAHATTFTDDVHIVAVVKLMRTKQELIVCQLVGAFRIITLKSYLVQILLLQFIQLFKSSVVWTLARS